MGPILTFIALWIVTGQTQEHNLLETLYDRAVSSTIDQQNDNLSNAQLLASDQGTSNNPCTQKIQPKKAAIDDPNVKYQLIHEAAPNLNNKVPEPNGRRADEPVFPKLKTIDHLNNMYYDTDLIGLDSLVVPPIEKDVPFYNDELRNELGNYPEAGDYDYVTLPTTELPPTTTTTLSPIQMHTLDNFLVSWRKKNYEATPSPLDKNKKQRKISSESQTNFVSSVNEEIARTQSNMDCGDKKQTDDEFLLFRTSNFEDATDSAINVHTNTKKGEDVVEPRYASQNTQKYKKNGRICYACSTATNPNCLVPNNRTTIKYCQGDHDSCIMKTFEVHGTKDTTKILTRDCGSSCSDNSLPGVSPEYSKCSLCHEDLCNGAFSLNKQNLIFICSMLLVTVIKSWVKFTSDNY